MNTMRIIKPEFLASSLLQSAAFEQEFGRPFSFAKLWLAPLKVGSRFLSVAVALCRQVD